MELGWPAGIGSLWERGGECDQVGMRAGAATWKLQPAGQREEGRELASLWLLVPWRETMTAVRHWNRAVQRSQPLRSVLPCSDPPCCLHHHSISTQHLPDKILLTSPPHQEGPEGYKSPHRWKACLQLGNFWSEVICGWRRNLFHYLFSLI